MRPVRRWRPRHYRLLRRPRPTRDADPPRPRRRRRGGLRRGAIHLRRPRARGRGQRSTRSPTSSTHGRPHEWRAPHPGVRDRPHAGDRVEAGPAARREQIPQLPLFLDSPMARRTPEIYRALPRSTRRRRAPPRGRGATRLPGAAGHARGRVQADRPGGRRPTSSSPHGMLTGGRSVGLAEQPPRRPARHRPLRRLPGRGDARRASRPRRGQRADLGRQIPGPGVGPLARRVLGARGRARTPRLAGHFVRGRRPGDAGVPRDVYLVHGDPPAQEALLPKVDALGFTSGFPAWLQTVSLD